MWNFSQETVGSQLIIGKITQAILNEDGHSIIGVRLEDGTIVDADALVVACGPWTDQARSWFGSEVCERIPRMYGVKVSVLLMLCLDMIGRNQFLNNTIKMFCPNPKTNSITAYSSRHREYSTKQCFSQAVAIPKCTHVQMEMPTSLDFQTLPKLLPKHLAMKKCGQM